MDFVKGTDAPILDEKRPFTTGTSAFKDRRARRGCALRLTGRTPRCRPPADRRVLEQCAMARTNAFSFPPLMDQPRLRRIGVIVPDSPHRFARDETRGASQRAELRWSQAPRAGQRRNLRTPENFISHPVAHAGKSVLQQKDRFDWRPAMTLQEIRHVACAKIIGANIRRGAPPRGRICSMIESHAPKEPRITEDERAFRLPQEKVIVFLGPEIRSLDAQGSAHPKVQAEPIVAGKAEEHLLAARG